MRCLSIVTATMRTRSKNATCRSSVGRKRKSNTIFDEGEVHKKAKNIRQVRGHKKTGAIGKSCKNLVQAVSCNDLKCICDILKKTKHIKKTCKADLKAAILKAIENGKLKILQHVVLHAGKLDVTFWSRSIRLAVQHGQVDILEYLLEHNTNTSDVEKAFMLSDEKGNTALHLCQQNDTAANHMTRLILKAVQLLAKITRSRCIDAQNKLGETALIKAVKNMRLENVVQLHLAGADTSVKDKHGNTAVSLAQELEISYLFEKRYSRISESPIVFDDAEDLQFYLVSKRENPDYEFGISKDILLEEMFNDKWDKLKDPLPGHDTCKVCQERKRNKRNATYCTKHMYTLLPFTCKEKEKVDLLIKAGADSLRSGRLGPWNIPLLMAVHQGDTDLVNLMLINQRQHDVDASIYASALKISVKCNYSEIFNILLPFLKENMSNIKEQNICQEILETAVDLGYENYLTRLLDVVKNIDLFRLLTIAVKRGNLPMFAKFQKMKCSFFKVIKSSQGTDLLIIACSVNSHLMVSRLLNLGVNTMYKDSSRCQPLMYCKTVEILRLVLQHGADINHCHRVTIGDSEYNIHTALTEAVKTNSMKLFRVLIENGAHVGNEFALFLMAFGLKQTSKTFGKLILDTLADANLDVSETTEDSLKLFFSTAVRHGNISVLKVMLKKIFYFQSSLDIALSESVMKNDRATINFLLKSGADINFRDNLNGDFLNGETIIMKVIRCTYLADLIPFLVGKGADLNVEDGSGRTALMLAADRSTLMLSALLKAGANVNAAADIDGSTVLTKVLSKIYFDSSLIKSILERGGRANSMESNFAVHRCIVLGKHDLLSSLIHEGGLVPTVINERNTFFSNIAPPLLSKYRVYICFVQ